MSPVPTIRTRTDSLVARILRAMSDDPARPSSYDDLANALGGVPRTSIYATVDKLLRDGAVDRVEVGRYVRLVGEVLA